MGRVIASPTIRWGVNAVPWTFDIEKHAEIGLRDFRSNWCRLNPASWSTPTFNAGSWTLADHAALAKEIIGRGGRFVEVLVDRQEVLPGVKSSDQARVAITRAIVFREKKLIALVLDELREVREKMPADVIGELYNGDEFGPGCGFPWDPLRRDFWDVLGTEPLPTEKILNRFRAFAYSVARLWATPLLRRTNHVYLYPDRSIGYRKTLRLAKVLTEVGIHESFMDDASELMRFVHALIQARTTWAFWHQPWPGNPGDGAAFRGGNQFMYERAAFDKWLGSRAWPDYEGIMLRQSADLLRAVIRATSDGL